MQPFFSVVTPNFNSGNKLQRCHDSIVKNQVSLEHIIIDDGSDDSSLNYIERLKYQLQPESGCCDLIVLENSTNLGPGPSRNKGVSIAKGEYILFCDADDYFSSNALDILQELIFENDYPDVVIFGYSKLSNKHREDVLVDETRLVEGPDLLSDYLLDHIISSPWCKGIKRDIVRGSRFPSLRVSQDAIFNFKIFNKAKNALYVSKSMYFFDKTGDSITRKEFTIFEIKKYMRSWFFFEKTVKKYKMADDTYHLLVARKFRFCVINFIFRLSFGDGVSKDVKSFVRKLVYKVAIKEKAIFSKHLNLKEKFFSIVFLIFPSLAIGLLNLFYG